MEQNWRELKERKEEFLHIVRVLENYASAVGLKTSKFRKALSEVREEELCRIYFKQIGKYEYEVKAHLKLEDWLEDNWIHIDGIQEERDRFEEIGKVDHPVFGLTNLSDLYKIAI